jgi:predicted Na+-dependent transporter
MKLLNRIYPYFAIVGSILLVTKIVLNKVLIVYLDYDLGNYNKIATIIIDIIILMFGIGLLNDKSIDNKRYWKTILLIFFVQIMVRYPFIVKGFQFNLLPTPQFYSSPR